MNCILDSNSDFIPEGIGQILLRLSEKYVSLRVLHCTIRYRCEDGRFPVSSSDVTFSNPDLLSRSETGVDSGIRSSEQHLSDMSSMSDSHWWFHFTKK